jgi:hypothetical protein
MRPKMYFYLIIWKNQILSIKPGDGSIDGPVRGCYLVIFDRRAEARELPWSEKLKLGYQKQSSDCRVLNY